MFDIIGKRRWYFLISALVTLPGLFFIFVAPLFSKDAGLQFTIDYTGGTKWEIRFENHAVTTDQVREVFAANGLEASVLATGDGFLEIKTEPIGLRPPAPSPTPAPTIAPSASASDGESPSASVAPSDRRPRRRDRRPRRRPRPRRARARVPARHQARRPARALRPARHRAPAPVRARPRARLHRRRPPSATRSCRPRAGSRRWSPPSKPNWVRSNRSDR